MKRYYAVAALGLAICAALGSSSFGDAFVIWLICTAPYLVKFEVEIA